MSVSILRKTASDLPHKYISSIYGFKNAGTFSINKLYPFFHIAAPSALVPFERNKSTFNVLFSCLSSFFRMKNSSYGSISLPSYIHEFRMDKYVVIVVLKKWNIIDDSDNTFTLYAMANVFIQFIMLPELSILFIGVLVDFCFEIYFFMGIWIVETVSLACNVTLSNVIYICVRISYA